MESGLAGIAMPVETGQKDHFSMSENPARVLLEMPRLPTPVVPGPFRFGHLYRNMKAENCRFLRPVRKILPT